MPVSAASSWLSLFLVFWTGSAWFAVIHPGIVRRTLKLLGFARDWRPGDSRVLDRLIGLLYGAAGMLMLVLPRWWP